MVPGFSGVMLQDEQSHQHVPKGTEGSTWMKEVGPVPESTFGAPQGFGDFYRNRQKIEPGPGIYF